MIQPGFAVLVPGRDLGSESEGVVYAEEGFGFVDRVRWVGVGPNLSEDAVGFFDDVLVHCVIAGGAEVADADGATEYEDGDETT